MKKYFVLAALLLVSAAAHAEEIYLHKLGAANPKHPDLVLGKSVGRIGAVSGFGTGFLVAPNKIISNRHVIGDVAKTHLPVWMTKHETDGPVHGYIAEVIFAHEEYDMAVGLVNWTRPNFTVPAPLTLMRSSEFDSRFQSAGGNVRIKTIGHSRDGPKIRQIGDYVMHNLWILGHLPIHAHGGSGSPVFFENGNAVVGVAVGIANWTVSRLFHDQRHDYFGDLTAVIEAPLDPTDPKLLAGHASDAKSAAYSPNGQAIAVGSGDSAIRVWNANWSGAPKAPIHTLQGHTAAVLSVAYSPNGQTIASGSLDSTVHLWNAGTGAKIRMLRHSSGVTSVAYSPDGQTIASGGVDNTIRIWNANTGAETRTLRGHTATVNSIAYSPNGQAIASGSDDDTIQVWNAATGAHIRTLRGHTASVNSVAYSPNGQTILSGSDDDTIRIWNANTGAPIRTLQGHTNDVVSAAYSPDGLTIASGSADSTVRIWNANTGAHIRTLEWYKWWHKGIVWFAAYSPDSQKIVSRSADDTIRVWNIATRPIASVSGPIDSQTGAFKVTIAFSSAVTGFASSDIVVTNGSVINFAGSGASYTATIEPSGAGAVTVSVPANAASNIWGSSEASNIYSADYRAQQILTRHTNRVVSIAYSPDGLTIAAGSDDNTVRLWDANTGAHLQTLRGHADRVKSVAYSPDGQTIASGSYDRTVRLWDANTGAHLRTLQYPNWVFTAAYSPDGQTIAVAGAGSSTIRLWNANTGEHIRTLQGHRRTIYSAAYSPDGLTIASGSGDNTVRLWNANTGEHIRTLQGHTAAVFSVAYSSDGQTIASGSEDNKVRIWNANTGAHIRTLQGHTNWVFSAAYSPDGQTIASGSGDNTIRTWNADTGEHLQTFRGHTDLVRSVAYSPNGQTIASGSGDNTIRLWNISDLATPITRLTTTVFGPSSTQTGAFDVTVVFSSAVAGFTSSDIVATNGAVINFAGSGVSYIATIEPISDGAVTVSVPANAAVGAFGNFENNEASNVYSVEYRAQQVLRGHRQDVFTVAYSPDGQTIASGGGDNTIRLWNANTGAHLRTLHGHTNRIMSVAYSPDSQTLASGSEDSTIRIWDANTGAHLRTLHGHTNRIMSVAYSPDGQTIASGGYDETIRIWDANTGAHLRTLQYLNWIYSVAYSADGQTIAAAGADNTIQIWNANTGAEIRTLQGITFLVYSLAYSPDGQTLAAAGGDGEIHLWNVNFGAPMRTLQGHTDRVFSIAYSPDGQAIVSGSLDATIRIWNAKTGAHLRTLQGHTADVFSVAYSPDGQKIVSGGEDNTVRIWGVSDLAPRPTTTSFTAQLRQGLNMLHVPVNDPSMEKMSDLYAALGGSQDVQFLLAYSPESNLFKAYTEGLAGSDLPLSDETAVIASMKSAKSVTFTGGLLKRKVSLRAGMNMIGVTRSGAVQTIGDLADLSTVPLTVIALKHDDTGNALFILANDSTDAAKGGEGYIILAESDTELDFDGSAWSNDASTAAASAEAVAYNPSATPLLLVEGSVAREDNLAPLNGLEITVKNMQTGQTASDLAGRAAVSGSFSLPLLALTGDSYAIGDAFDLRVVDSSGTFGVQSVRVVLDKESVSEGRIDIGQLLATAVPSESSLLPNYPNPFNPETWIPFELAESSRVTITIYNAAGQTVRALELGQLPAGTYRSRSRSAHWDGRNALGEPVASGVYYVRIEAGSFTALRRMVVLK